MQFRKLRNFFNLINVQRQCHCHQRCCRHRHHHHHHCHRHNYFASCKWNLLTFIVVLIALTRTVTLATASIYLNDTKSLQQISTHQQRHQAKNLNNVAILASPKSENYNSNATDTDFERVLFEQLKREQKSKENADADETRSLDGNYNAAIAAQRKTILSRKRRYLLFPEGSSFQVVYDGIVGIVDYTNYLILGITLALAWELPTKPPSEMLEDIKMHIQDGTLLLPRNDTAKNITYIDTNSKKSQQRQFSKPNSIDFAYQKAYNNRNPYYNYRKINQQTGKHRVMQPAFMPPMHRNYYHPNYGQSSSTYMMHTKPPMSSTKFNYYFQHPKAKSSTGGAASYSPYYGEERLGDWRRKDNYYYYKNNVSHKPAHPFSKWLPTKTYALATDRRRHEAIKYPWWNLSSRLTNALRQGTSSKDRPPMTATARQFNNINNNYKEILQRTPERQQQQRREEKMSKSGYYQSNAPTATSRQRKHRIYPVFGKRSLPDTNAHSVQQKSPTDTSNVRPHLCQEQHQKRQQQQQRQWQETHRNHQNEHQQESEHQPPRQRRRCGIHNDELSKFDRIHIRHHRRTRHTFYEKIEKYLDKRGSHGHHCVLRALCETGQKSNEREPGSFLGELMRALFTMPEPIEDELHRLEYKESRYDAAHAYAGDCAARYFHCKDSLWKSHFVA